MTERKRQEWPGDQKDEVDRRHQKEQAEHEAEVKRRTPPPARQKKGE